MKTRDSTAPLGTSFYDGAAATYDRLMVTPSTRRMRRNFLTLVRSNTPSSGPILDFGCGTGIDARYYAWLGHHVLAYDPSSQMLARLRRRCASAISAGRVVPVSGSAETCLQVARSMAPFSCIASNFSALNHVDEPEPLLAGLSSLLAPDGRIVLSLLNPWYWRDLCTGWWWRSRIASLRHGGFVVSLGGNRTVRHDPARIGRSAGLRRCALHGALGGRARDWFPGRAPDALVFVVLARP